MNRSVTCHSDSMRRSTVPDEIVLSSSSISEISVILVILRRRSWPALWLTTGGFDKSAPRVVRSTPAAGRSFAGRDRDPAASWCDRRCAAKSDGLVDDQGHVGPLLEQRTLDHVHRQIAQQRQRGRDLLELAGFGKRVNLALAEPAGAVQGGDVGARRRVVAHIGDVALH